MKILVVHHSADYDGLFSGAVAYHWLAEKQGNNVEMIGWDFGDEPVFVSQYHHAVYVIDLPPTAVDIPKMDATTELIWIDHHKSSIQEFPNGFDGVQIDGVAACRLAWQYFYQGAHGSGLNEFPTFQDFKDRKVSEPLALTLAGEYDVWDKSDADAERFQFGLTANRYRSAFDCLPLLHSGATGDVELMCQQGQAAMDWQAAFAADVCENRGYMVEFHGLKFWCLASAHARNSMWFPQESVPKEADALMCYRIPGNGTISVSLYHKPGREDLDLSEIAKANGGGGHRGACGFSMTTGQAIVGGILK